MVLTVNFIKIKNTVSKICIFKIFLLSFIEYTDEDVTTIERNLNTAIEV